MNAYRMSALTLLLIVGVAYATWADDCSKISVMGSATKQLAPDVAYVTVFVNGDGVLMSDAAKKADDNVASVLKAIKEGRTNSITDIAVTIVDVGEKSAHTWSSDAQSAPPRPQVSEQLRITIPPDTTLAYEIIDAAIRAGAILSRETMTHYSGEVSGAVVYGVKDGSAIEDDLKKDAMEDARKEAERTAEWAGKSVGPLCSVGCQSVTSWSQGMGFDGKTAEYPTKYLSIDPKEVEIKACTSATFELQAK